LKKFVFALILLLGIIFIIGSFSELREIGSVLSKGNAWFLGLAVCMEGLWIVNFGMSFKTLYGLVGIEKKLLPLTRLVSAVNFVNIVAPSAGMSGMAVIYSDATRNGHSSARVTVGSLLYLLFDYFGLLSVIFIGLIILGFYDKLNVTDILAYILFLTLAVTLGGVLVLAARSEAKLTRATIVVSRFLNKITGLFIKRTLVTEDAAENFASEVVEGVTALKHIRRGWLWPLILTLTNKILLVGILGVTFLAFHVETTLAVVIAGFSIAYLFVIISPTPAGVGIVEGVMTLALKSLGIALEAAVVVTLAYRAVTFWLPLFIGMISFRTLHQPQPQRTLPPA